MELGRGLRSPGVKTEGLGPAPPRPFPALWSRGRDEGWGPGPRLARCLALGWRGQVPGPHHVPRSQPRRGVDSAPSTLVRTVDLLLSTFPPTSRAWRSRGRLCRAAASRPALGLAFHGRLCPQETRASPGDQSGSGQGRFWPSHGRGPCCSRGQQRSEPCIVLEPVLFPPSLTEEQSSDLLGVEQGAGRGQNPA